MQAQWIVEHCNVFHDIVLRRLAGWIVLSGQPFRFQRTEKALYHGVIPAIAFAAHAAQDAMCIQQFSEHTAGELYAAIGIMEQSTCGQRRQIAIVSASHTRLLFKRRLVNQPTTLREYRSMATARYNQPSPVQQYVMSVHTINIWDTKP